MRIRTRITRIKLPSVRVGSRDSWAEFLEERFMSLGDALKE